MAESTIKKPSMTVRAPCALEPIEAEHLVEYLEGLAEHTPMADAEKLRGWAQAVRSDYITHPLFIVRA